jgi:hypothetical protein
MNNKSLPKFTAPASKLWASIPANIQKKLLSNVWCARCGHEITIINSSGTVKAGNLSLVGKCSECQGDVARQIELKGKSLTDHDLVVSKEKLERAQALIETKQLIKESESVIKSYVLLLSKKTTGTITKDEKAEYDRLEKLELPKMTEKMKLWLVNLEDKQEYGLNGKASNPAE